MEDRIQRMKELVSILREAGKAYYQESREIMSNFEYDKLYDELVSLEKETGVTLSGSPSQQVGYEILSELPKETHGSPMLSLDKTKSVEDLQEWLGDQKGLLSWKMDGLTIVLTYEEGTLAKAVTRGNGETGEVITPNARVFANIPLNISYQGQLILRGEAVITYSDFERINSGIEDVDAKYKNPRNLCSGSVRQLNSQITAERNVHFEAFALVKADGVDFHNSRKAQFEWLKGQGFEVVHYEASLQTNILEEYEAHVLFSHIKEYEKKENTKISYIGFCQDSKSMPRYKEIDITPYDELYKKAYVVSWADVFAVNYYTEQNYMKKEVPEAVEKYFLDKDWNEFNVQEQIIFQGDTVYWCVY